MTAWANTSAAVRWSSHDEPPFCDQNAAVCSTCAPKVWPRFWEGRLKALRCFNKVIEHERSENFRYDLTIQMRTDLHMVGSGHNTDAKSVNYAVRNYLMKSQIVFFKPYSPHPGYGQADWFWLAPRDLSQHLSELASAPCSWLRCISNALGGEAVNERILIEWALHNGSHVAPMPLHGTSAVLINHQSSHEVRQCNQKHAKMA